MSTHGQIVIGIITGIITSAVIALSLSTFKKIIIPWYRGIIYSGICINGKWTSQIKDNDIDETAMLNISQKANRVKAIMTVSKNHAGNVQEIKTYSLQGEFENRFLSLRGKNIDTQQIGVDVMLLEVKSGGDKMHGNEAWFSVDKNKINSADVEWIRV